MKPLKEMAQESKSSYTGTVVDLQLEYQISQFFLETAHLLRLLDSSELTTIRCALLQRYPSSHTSAIRYSQKYFVGPTIA